MKMKKLLAVLAVAVLAAWTCQAADYNNGHMYSVRQFRVALGSGTAPSAADMATIRLHNGDMVLNTDDSANYLMTATNTYVKFTSAGAIVIQGITLDSNTVTNAVASGTTLPAANGAALTNLAAGNIASGNLALAAITNALVTGTLAANLTGNIAQARITNALATAGSVIGGNIPIAALTNAAGGGLCVVTNKGVGYTNIITYIGTVSGTLAP